MSGYDRDAEAAENAAYRDAVRQARRRAAAPGRQRGGDPTSLGPVLQVAVIGSADGCELVLAEDVAVAGRHVEVRLHPGGMVSVRPLATLGTTIHRMAGGRRRRLPVVSTMALRPGDVLEVGRTRSVPWRPR